MVQLPQRITTLFLAATLLVGPAWAQPAGQPAAQANPATEPSAGAGAVQPAQPAPVPPSGAAQQPPATQAAPQQQAAPPQPPAPSQATTPAQQAAPGSEAAQPSGTPAVVLDTGEADGIIGRSVRSATGEDMGRIVDVIVSGNSQVRAAVIDFGGFLGVGSRKIAVDWRALHFAPDGKQGRVTLALTRNQVRVSPEFKAGEPIVILGLPATASAPTAATQAAAPAQTSAAPAAAPATAAAPPPPPPAAAAAAPQAAPASREGAAEPAPPKATAP